MAGQRSDQAESRRGGLLRPALVGLIGLVAVGLLASLGRSADSPSVASAPRSAVTAAPKIVSNDSASPYKPTTVDANGVTCSYGYAVWGKLKYGPDFKHFDYVNPDAPKGGTYHYAMDQANFDTVSQFSLLGVFRSRSSISTTR